MIFTNDQRKMIVLSSFGGALEFYDFIIFVFFAKILSQLFFPAQDSVISLMATFGLFAVGYLMRPLGGILFGHLGDKLGRKKTFVATVILMAIPTFLMGFLPTYQQVGILAPILLIALRMLQGLSVGGEVPGAIVFVTETVPSQHRGLACAVIFFGLNMGLVFGSLLASLFTTWFTQEQLMTWGWRIPFCLGGLLGGLGFYLRRRMAETPLFQAVQQTAKWPIKEVLREYPGKIGQGVMLASLGAVLVSLLFLYMPTYLSTFFHFSLSKVMTLNTIMLSVFSFQVLLMGYWSDRVGYLKLMRFGMIGFILLSYPLYCLFTLQNDEWMIIAVVSLALLSSFITSCFPSILVGLYPTQVRYTGVALVYNIGFAIAGGLTPLFATSLIHWTDNLLSPSFYLATLALLAFVVTFFMRSEDRLRPHLPLSKPRAQ